MSSVLYFNTRVTIDNVKDAFTTALGVDVKISNQGLFGESSYCTLSFSYTSDEYSYRFFSHNYISGGRLDGTNRDTLTSNSQGGDHADIASHLMKVIAKYFGGELLDDDNDEDNFITIQLTNEKIVSNRSIVLSLLMSNGFDMQNANDTLELMLKNKDLFLNFLS